LCLSRVVVDDDLANRTSELVTSTPVRRGAFLHQQSVAFAFAPHSTAGERDASRARIAQVFTGNLGATLRRLDGMKHRRIEGRLKRGVDDANRGGNRVTGYYCQVVCRATTDYDLRLVRLYIEKLA